MGMFAAGAESSRAFAQPHLRLPTNLLDQLGELFQPELAMATHLGRIAVCLMSRLRLKSWRCLNVSTTPAGADPSGGRATTTLRPTGEMNFDVRFAAQEDLYGQSVRLWLGMHFQEARLRCLKHYPSPLLRHGSQH
jgi:hypothetical protein